MEWQLFFRILLSGLKAFDIETLYYIVKPVEKKQLYYMRDNFFDGYTSIWMLAGKVGRTEEDHHFFFRKRSATTGNEMQGSSKIHKKPACL